MRPATKSRLAVMIAATSAFTALALMGFLLYCRAAARTAPAPGEQNTAETLIDAVAGDDPAPGGFPTVDWAYWQSVNPSVIGWITIPGTDVSAPVLQAHADDPEHWLDHDVYDNYNPHGAIYLDAECEADGLASKNAVICGHHFGYDVVAAPFGIVADYADKDFAAEHETILIQTPTSKTVYHVRFAQVVLGSKAAKRTSFSTNEDFEQWYAASIADAAMVLDAQTAPSQIISLVTCSYTRSNDDRTVVVASAG